MKRRWWVEFPAIFLTYQLFEVARGHIHPHAAPALRNARWLEDLERWTWTLHEARLNQWVFAHKTIAQAMNIYYGTVHFIVPPIVLIWLWRRHPSSYPRLRNALVALTLIGMVFFIATPLAPPRLVPAQAHATFRDTTPFGGLGPLDRGNFKDDNPDAAMPSLHIAWSTWCACAVIAAARRRRRWWMLAYPLVTLIVVMGTANHWFFDGVGGWIVLAAGWAAAGTLSNARQRGGEDAWPTRNPPVPA